MAILAECPVCHRKLSIARKACKCGANMDKEKKSKKVKYHIVYRDDNGKQKWRSVGSFKDLDAYSFEDAKGADARLIVAKRQNEIEIFDPKPTHNITFSEMSKWYLDLEKVKALASYETMGIYLRKFNSVFGNVKVAGIKAMDLENHQERRKKEGLKPKTIDDEINYVQTMVIKAFDNDLVDGQALKGFRKVKRLLSGKKRGTNTRTRTLAHEEIEAIARAAKEQPTIDKLLFGYWTGMRAGEIMKLTWKMIDLQNRIITLSEDVTKEGKEKKVPIGDVAYSILTRDKRHIRRVGGEDHVFTYWGKPITRAFTTGFKTASKEAGIPWGREIEGGWIFHDLRRTFKTDMRKAGVHKSVIDAIVGHTGNDMDSRYNIIDDEDRLEAIRQLEAYREDVRQTVRQEAHEKNEALQVSELTGPFSFALAEVHGNRTHLPGF